MTWGLVQKTVVWEGADRDRKQKKRQTTLPRNLSGIWAKEWTCVVGQSVLRMEMALRGSDASGNLPSFYVRQFLSPAV